MTTHRIGLPPQLRALYIERIPATLGALIYDGHKLDLLVEMQEALNKTLAFGVDLRAPKVAAGNGYWRLPIHVGHNPNLGIFLYLYDDGKIERITIREDEGDEIALIKPSDKDIP